MDFVVAVIALLPSMAATAVGILRVRCSRHQQMLLFGRVLPFLLEMASSPNNLATEGAESEGIKEAALADFTGVGDTFAGPWLWPFVKEHDLRAVDNVGLN